MTIAVRKTIAREVRMRGRGLHAGLDTNLALKPAAAGTGIVFRRVDLEGGPTVRAGDVQHDGPPLRTALKAGAAEIHTVEHLLAALTGLGVTDLEVELDHAEVPGMDGSALEFTGALQEAGLRDLDGARLAPLTVREKVTVAEGEAHLTIAPYDGLKVTYTLDYPGHPLAQGTAEFEIDSATFLKEIAPARTFCLKQEAEMLQKAGFGKGANTQNTVVVDGETAVDTTLRFPDEPVRHKILDLLGDLYVLGRPLRGHITAHRSGHALNRALAGKLAALAADEAGNEEQAMSEASATVMDVNAIKGILPHRYPFLLVDRIVEMETQKRIVGIKNVSANEQFFEGHFPGNPIMPGVLILEALAQTGAILVLDSLGKHGSVVLFAGMDKVAFRRKVVPGDQLRLECTLDRMRGNFGRYTTQATVDGELAAEAVMKFMLDGGKE